MTIAKTQINAIAASLFHAEPFVYYNDIPETETAGMPDFKKLAEGQIPSTPPFTINRSIKLTGAGAVPVHIYSKSAKSRYEMYKKVILKEPGNIFCFMDKPYAKSQATEPALAACFDQAAIFARFNTIAAQVENCPQ
ncbi:Plancitoxin-1 [Trichinella spiralis]|uniref:Plancitoxin-1 n=1 Tax=Trichinella spiralis TaxID=6334 RepID=A0ABR3K2Q8_TRISP